MRSATEEALGLWSRYAPIDFVEVPDAGPPPSDTPYPADGTPDIRIGHHDASAYTHAFYPWAGSGLARDVHLRTRYADPFYWGLGDDPSIYSIDILGVLVHELGHSLGLFHYEAGPSVMNATAIAFNGLGTGFLFPPDIQSIQLLYGRGVGWVRPLPDPAPIPEPGTWILLLAPLIAILARRPGRLGV